MTPEDIFAPFFLGGFESASQRRRDGVRLDLIRATGHDRNALADYRACAGLGFFALRDGLRWHRVEDSSARQDWSSWLPMLAAAEEAGVRIVWNLHHYGTPDHIDLRSSSFVAAFARFAASAAIVHRQETGRPLLACPINEISFLAWAIGEGYFPLAGGASAREAKRQLVRAALAAARSIRKVDPKAGIFWSEPLVHVAPRLPGREHERQAEAYRRAQFEALDMLLGRLEPELGGAEDIVDHVGVNFYPHNQWYFKGPTIPLGHHAWRPLGAMLRELSDRYARPLWLAETGAEGSARPAWLHYVCDEVRTAMTGGADIRAICLYPVTHYPGWDNSRPVETGLFGNVDRDGLRPVYSPLIAEVERQRGLMRAGIGSAGDAILAKRAVPPVGFGQALA